MRRLIAVTCAATAAIAAPAYASVNGGTPGRMSDARLLTRALAFAKRSGEVDPRSVKAVAADHADAVRVTSPGDEIQPDGVRVDAIVMTGRFSTAGEKGGGSGTVRVLTAVLDAATGAVLGFGLGNRAPDLSPLGRPAALARLTGKASGAVRLSRGGRTVATAKGAFSFTVAPGTYRLSAAGCHRTVHLRTARTTADLAC